jgi:hypothetical protein
MPIPTTPKGMLITQAEVPKFALANTPLSTIGVSMTGALANIAGALPEMGGTPAPPAAPASVKNLFKGLEATLPAGLPKIFGAEVTGKVTEPFGPGAGLKPPVPTPSAPASSILQPTSAQGGRGSL